MGSKLVIVGDTHFTIEEPFFSAGKKFVEWFLEQEFNSPDNYMIHVGDLYHHSNPNPKVHELGIHWLSNCKFSNILLELGNHCYNRAQDSYSIAPLSKIRGVRIVDRPEVLQIKNINSVILPFVYERTSYLKERTMKEVYEKEIPNSLYGAKDADFMFHHVQDESIQFGDVTGIDLSWFKGERIGGHIHKKSKGYLGSPLITRYDERNKDSFILLIDTETKEKTYVRVPTFLDYYQIDYESTVFEPTVEFPIYDIVNAPSRDAAQQKFKQLYLRDIQVRKLEEDSYVEKEQGKFMTIKDHFQEFCSKNKVPAKLKAKLEGYL